MFVRAVRVLSFVMWPISLGRGAATDAQYFGVFRRFVDEEQRTYCSVGAMYVALSSPSEDTNIRVLRWACSTNTDTHVLRDMYVGCIPHSSGDAWGGFVRVNT